MKHILIKDYVDLKLKLGNHFYILLFIITSNKKLQNVKFILAIAFFEKSNASAKRFVERLAKFVVLMFQMTGSCLWACSANSRVRQKLKNCLKSLGQ